jgi:hypothetical protein
LRLQFNVNLDPTLFKTKLEGKARENCSMAFQPVQCMGDDDFGRHFSQFRDGLFNNGFKSRTGQVKSADNAMNGFHAGNFPGVFYGVDNPRMRAA